jgi:hypothetical protein
MKVIKNLLDIYIMLGYKDSTVPAVRATVSVPYKHLHVHAFVMHLALHTATVEVALTTKFL